MVVGVRDYGDDPRTQLPGLRNAVNDACRVYGVLTRRFGFTGRLLARPEDVEQADALLFPGRKGLRGEVAGSGNRLDILEALDWVRREAGAEDLFILFFAGHGSQEDLGYLIPYGAQEGRHSTYLMYEALWPALSEIPCRDKVLLLDCCFAGLATLGAGPSPSPATAPGEARPGQVVILCATGAYDVAADAYTDYPSGGERSRHSPFAEAVAGCLEGLAPGQALSTRDLFEQVHARVTRELVPDPLPTVPRARDVGVNPVAPPPRYRRLEPFHWASPGAGIGLKRPGLELRVEGAGPRDLLVLRAGRRREYPLVAEGGDPPYQWSVAGEAGIRIENHGLLAVDGRRVAVGRHTITLEVADRRSVTARRSLAVEVLPEEMRPLTLDTRRLAPCFVGLPYRFALDAGGGVPPFDWEVESLPPGWALDAASGTLSGVATATAAGRAEHRLRITVRDQAGQTESRVFRLPVIDPARYCEVPAGPCQVGHHPTPARTHELNRLEIRAQVERLVAGSVPAGEVYLPRYYIKRHPVTNAEWEEFVRQTGHPATPVRWSEEDFDRNAEGAMPVTDLAVRDMEAYCAWRGTRLPSGWEWEKAARGGDGRLFPWGDTYDVNRCNGAGLHWGRLTRVDQFPEGAGPCGALDLVGNAREFVRHFRPAHGEWLPLLRGGSFSEESVTFLNALVGRPAPSGWRFVPTPEAAGLVPGSGAHDPETGFRDVIEIEDEPAHPQGFVPVEPSFFLSPVTGAQVRTLERVDLGRYAVTNEEYAEFVRATLHPPPAHWRGPGAEPFPPADRHLPVTWVSFADAEAFCRWKSGRLGRECRVMTLKVWQAAVHGPGMQSRGFQPRRFPWGDDDVPLVRNGPEIGWGGPMRVFELPEGCGPCGAFHLVGNVAQWTSPTTVVGGSWLRGCAHPKEWVETLDPAETVRRPDVGFRYACVQPAARPGAAAHPTPA